MTLEPPVVLHELLAPVRRVDALRGPAVRLLRTAAFGGLVVGGILGVQASRRLPGNPLVIGACGALVGLALATGAVGAALVVSGRRINRHLATAMGLVLISWSLTDIWLTSTTSPATLLAQVALWPEHFTPSGFVGLAVAASLVAFAMTGLGGTSVEAARRRAGLVSQLRFAVTLQDLRTVVLLRRQLAEEQPRATPWIRLRRKESSRVYPTWKRDLQGYLRFPVARLARLVGLAVVSGLCFGLAWRGFPIGIVGAALALFVAAYEANEPIGQEVDHPSRWAAPPVEPGKLLVQHLPAAVVFMLVHVLLVATASLILVPAEVVTQLAPVLWIPVAGAAAVAGAVATVAGTPGPTADLGRAGMSGVGDGMGGDIFGYQALARLLLPPAIVVVAVAPVLAAGSDIESLKPAAVSNLVSFSMISTVIGGIYVYTRRPSRL